MKTSLPKILFFYFLALVAVTSCRTEENELIQTPPEEILTSSSSTARLMQKTSSNDGSNDNIIDYANCFNIKLPINVTVNGENILVNSKEDYKIIEHIFDDSDDDVDTLVITYPIQIVLDDFTEITINSYNELSNQSSKCKGENEMDDDIECLDFNYPITAFLFNSNNEMINTILIDSDSVLYHLIEDLDSYDLVSIAFPLTVTLFDGTELSINNLVALENTIKAYDNNCDEDDDYDYNDDDCNDCTPNELIDFLTNCSSWSVDKLERYGNNYDDYYNNYTFNFYENGTVSAYYANKTNYGTWTTSGTGNNIVVTINIPDLPYCNNNWVLHEISQYLDSKIDLRVGSNDRLRYKNICN